MLKQQHWHKSLAGDSKGQAAASRDECVNGRNAASSNAKSNATAAPARQEVVRCPSSPARHCLRPTTRRHCGARAVGAVAGLDYTAFIVTGEPRWTTRPSGIICYWQSVIYMTASGESVRSKPCWQSSIVRNETWATSYWRRCSAVSGRDLNTGASSDTRCFPGTIDFSLPESGYTVGRRFGASDGSF
ncbi:hypothetical protein OKW49_008463 [Paraburkholderia youngii]